MSKNLFNIKFARDQRWLADAKIIGRFGNKGIVARCSLALPLVRIVCVVGVYNHNAALQSVRSTLSRQWVTGWTTIRHDQPWQMDGPKTAGVGVSTQIRRPLIECCYTRQTA